MTVKDRLHQLVDELPEEELKNLSPAEALRMFDHIQRKIAELHDELRRVELDIRAKYSDDDSLGRMLLAAPADDEPETEEERQLVEEARLDLAAGRVISQEEIRREFGHS